MVDPSSLRRLAVHLEDRPCAPSLEGYGLVDGLRAAASLLDGDLGPFVHADEAADGMELADAPRVALASLVVHNATETIPAPPPSDFDILKAEVAEIRSAVTSHVHDRGMHERGRK